MNTHQLTTAIHTWKIKHNNEEMIQLFSSVHCVEDSIFRLETTGNLTGELESYRLQKTRMRDHIYRILRLD